MVIPQRLPCPPRGSGTAAGQEAGLLYFGVQRLHVTSKAFMTALVLATGAVMFPLLLEGLGLQALSLFLFCSSRAGFLCFSRVDIWAED